MPRAAMASAKDSVITVIRSDGPVDASHQAAHGARQPTRPHFLAGEISIRKQVLGIVNHRAAAECPQEEGVEPQPERRRDDDDGLGALGKQARDQAGQGEAAHSSGASQPFPRISGTPSTESPSRPRRFHAGRAATRNPEGRVEVDSGACPPARSPGVRARQAAAPGR